MNYKINKLPKSEVEIEIELNTAEWDKEVENAYQKNKGKYNIEGFRKGKAPRKVIEKMYGPTVFFEEALSEAFYNQYIEILNKEKDLEVVDSPSIDVKDMNDKGLTIIAKVTVKPEIKLTKYTDFGVKESTSHSHEVKDADVEAELKKAQEQNVRLVEVKREIKAGDVANIDFAGKIDGVAFDGGTAQGYDLEIGSHSFIDNFEDQLIGLKESDEKDVKVKFPSNYQVPELKDKPAVFSIKVNSVKEKVLPELNDEFASDVSEFNTLEEYKADIKAHLEEHMKEHIRIELENGILDKIVENLNVEIPTVMVDSELDNIFKDLEYRLMYQGLKLEDYANYLGKSVEELRKERRADAEKSVKIRLALQEIIKLENIGFSDEEYDAKVEEMAKSAKKSTKEYKNSLTEEHINYIKNDILMTKLMEFLVSHN